MSEVRSIHTLTHEAIVQLAREQAESGEPCSHGYPEGSTNAITWERNYMARKVELEAVDV